MLDEIKEFNQYVNEINVYKRFKYQNITNSASGIERAMIIISRQFLNMDIRSKDLDNYELAQEIIKAWCGYGDYEDENHVIVRREKPQGPFYKVGEDGIDKTEEFNEFYDSIQNRFSQFLIILFYEKVFKINSLVENGELSEIISNSDNQTTSIIETITCGLAEIKTIIDEENKKRVSLFEADKLFRKLQVPIKRLYDIVNDFYSNRMNDDELKKLNVHKICKECNSSINKICKTFDVLQRREHNLCNSLFNNTFTDNNQGNSYKENCYEGIVATAAEEGALKKRCLISLGNFLNDISYNGNALKKGIRDFVIKMVSYYFMKETCENKSEVVLNPRYECINEAEIRNWCITDAKKYFEDLKEFVFKYSEDNKDTNEAVFQKYFRNNNAQKFIICDKFMNKWKDRIFIEEIDVNTSIEEIKESFKEKKTIEKYIEKYPDERIMICFDNGCESSFIDYIENENGEMMKVTQEED